VVVAMWVRLGYLLHNVFSSSVISQRVNTVIYGNTSLIDIRAVQRDDLSVSKGA
jgi:hypothetical protein